MICRDGPRRHFGGGGGGVERIRKIFFRSFSAKLFFTVVNVVRHESKTFDKTPKKFHQVCAEKNTSFFKRREECLATPDDMY